MSLLETDHKAGIVQYFGINALYMVPAIVLGCLCAKFVKYIEGKFNLEELKLIDETDYEIWKIDEIYKSQIIYADAEMKQILKEQQKEKIELQKRKKRLLKLKMRQIRNRMNPF